MPAATSTPPAGWCELDDRGEPTGVLRENAAWKFRDRHSLPTLDEMVEACRDGLRVAATRGVTAIHDKDGWLGAFEVFQRLRERDELTLRVWQSLPADRLPELRAVGLRSGFGDDLLRLGYLKLFMDGTLGSATARLLDGSGVELTSRDRLEAVVREAAAAGWPVGVHAIGDAANRAALDAFEASARRLAAARPAPAHRARPAARRRRAAALRRGGRGGIGPVQPRRPRTATWPTGSGRATRARTRTARCSTRGARLANGSDAPVEELDPLRGIVAGVLRTLDERAPWRPHQAVTVDQALRATCTEPAWLARDERRRGTLAPGMLADLVILDRDPGACPPEELPEVRVLATMVGGRFTYVSDPSRLGITDGP